MEHLTRSTPLSDQTNPSGEQSWRKPLRNSTETTPVSSVETQWTAFPHSTARLTKEFGTAKKP